MRAAAPVRRRSVCRAENARSATRLAPIGALMFLLAVPALGRAQASDDEDLQRAVELFERSETLYNGGQFEEAADLLRQAYALHPDATLLFNLARALEGMGDLDGAIESYERYLREASDPPDRGAVEARLDTLRVQRAALAREAESWGESEEVEAEPEAAPPPDDAAEEPTELNVDPAPWLVLAGGVVLLGVGAGLGVNAGDLASRAQAEPVMAEAVALHDDANAFATAANTLLVLGGLTTLAGFVWGIVSVALSDGGEGERATLRIGPASIALTGRF